MTEQTALQGPDLDRDARPRLTPQQLERIRLTLVQERANLLRTIAEAGAGQEQSRSDAPNGIGETEHLVNSEQIELSLRVQALAQQALDDYDAALVRIEQGTYGTCVRCGRPIPVERLETIPAADMCVSCQSAPTSGVL